MKYVNIAIFLCLIVFITGCQKKEQAVHEPKKQKKVRVARRGPTMMKTKKSVESLS